MYISGLPNAACASLRPVAQASINFSFSQTIFIPRPPPPAVALRITGKPIFSAASSSCISSCRPDDPGSVGTPAALIGRCARILSPIRRIASDGGPIQVSLHLPADLGEVGVLRQKPVAGVHGIGAGDLGGRDDHRHVQVAQARRRRADAHRLVGELDVQRIGVAVECTATDSSPISRHARITRSAISPRFAINTFLNIVARLASLAHHISQRITAYHSISGDNLE